MADIKWAAQQLKLGNTVCREKNQHPMYHWRPDKDGYVDEVGIFAADLLAEDWMLAPAPPPAPAPRSKKRRS